MIISLKDFLGVVSRGLGLGLGVGILGLGFRYCWRLFVNGVTSAFMSGKGMW